MSDTIIVKDYDLVGKQFGNYKIISELGRGGMAIVYKADELSLNRVVALKVLSPKISEDETMIKRFQREAQAAARLNHPNIVHIYSIGEQDGINYFAMEYIKGKTLKQWRKEAGSLSIEEVLPIFVQTADALGEAHKAGLVHRDIKPSNIMIDSAGRAKITDFGIAHVAQTTTQLTVDGQFLGTPQYMSPEQCEGSTVDGRSDIYSLGVTLYEVLTGKSPYAAETPASILVKIMNGDLRPIREVEPGIPAPVESLLEKMLQKDRNKRLADTAELIKALEKLENELGDKSAFAEAPAQPCTQATMMAEPTCATMPGKEKARINWWIPGIAAAILLLAAAGLFAISRLRYAGGTSPEAIPSVSMSPPAATDDNAREKQSLREAEESTPAITEGAREDSDQSIRAGFVRGKLPLLRPDHADQPEDKEEIAVPAVLPAEPVNREPNEPAPAAKPAPPANSLIVTTTGDDEKADLITSCAESILGKDKFLIVDGSSAGEDEIADLAEYQLIIKISKLGSTTLNYLGKTSELYTDTLTMRIVRPGTGKIAASPLVKTVKYTAINAEVNLKEAVEQMVLELQDQMK